MVSSLSFYVCLSAIAEAIRHQLTLSVIRYQCPYYVIVFWYNSKASGEQYKEDTTMNDIITALSDLLPLLDQSEKLYLYALLKEYEHNPQLLIEILAANEKSTE